MGRLPFNNSSAFRSTISISLILLCWASAARAELPAYNTQIPTVFSGKLQKFSAPGAGDFDIYVSGPENAKAALVMIHEWWGLNPHIKGLADDLGSLGYRTYAVDLYNGKLTDNADMATMYMKMDDPAKSMAKLRAAITEAAKNHGKVATIGWCFGGGWSLKASLAEPEKVNATVIYYGALVSDPAELKKLTGPVLGIFGTQDKWITPESVEAFKEGLATAKVENTIKSYDADHAFANPSGARFKEEPAQDAWRTTLEFLAVHLLGQKKAK